MESSQASQLIDELFSSDYYVLVRYACRTTHDLDVAEDIVQEAMMLLYKALRTGKRIDNPKAWAFCVVRRLISKHLRSRQSKQEVSDVPLSALEAIPESYPTLAEECYPDELGGLLSLLTPREQEVILLRMTALKYREIADRLGISPKSVNTFLARALRKLQKAARTGSAPDVKTKYVGATNPKTLH